jgi:hypothetical protein
MGEVLTLLNEKEIDFLETVRRQTVLSELFEDSFTDDLGRLTGRCYNCEGRASIDDEKGLFYCFRCHTGGDCTKVIVDTTGTDFCGAIMDLAERLWIPYPIGFLLKSRSE